MKRYWTRTAFAIALFGTGPGLAATPISRHIDVSYGDLNLANPKGVAMLRERINAAARSVCAPEPPFKSFPAYLDYVACFRRSQQDAFAAISLMDNQKQARNTPDIAN
jgi:UrcA family protein